MKIIKKIGSLICNPIIWIYVISILFILLLALNILNLDNNFLFYTLLFLTSGLIIFGICTNPLCKKQNLIFKRKDRKNKAKDGVE